MEQVVTAPHAKPRLYYDCPLKAAFMAKYFGVRLERSDGDLLLDWDDMEDDLATCIASGSWEDWYVIHPDSLPLLDSLTDDQKAAMQLLGLWPEREGA